MTPLNSCEHALLERAALGVEIRRVVVELQEHERLRVLDGELGHPQPQRAEQLAGRPVGNSFDRRRSREPRLLLRGDRVDERFLRLEVAIDRAGADPARSAISGTAVP